MTIFVNPIAKYITQNSVKKAGPEGDEISRSNDDL
jgi:hypothetical protein